MRKYIYYRSAFFYALLLVLFGFTFCTKKLTQAVKDENVPIDVAQTTLLVQKYEHEDPMVYDPYFASDTDSLKSKTGFTYAAEKIAAEEAPKKKEHPLIVETNAHLDEYNDKLAKTFKSYKYPYALVDGSKLESDSTYENKRKYRYVLMRKPVLHCYIDPRGETFLSYRYMYYFRDRLAENNYPEIQVFSPSPSKTAKAIINKMNNASHIQPAAGI